MNLKKLVLYCRNKRRKVYISNNLKTAIKYNFDGLYIPSFNKKLGFRNIVKNNFEIIGSAHNVVELKTKEKQGCSAIFLSPIFKNDKKTKFLDIIKTNLIKKLTSKKIVCIFESIVFYNFSCLKQAKYSFIKKIFYS